MAEVTLRGIGEPPGPAIDESAEFADNKWGEPPRNCELIYPGPNSLGRLCTWIEAERCLGRNATHQWIEHEGRFIPTVVALQLHIAEPERVTSTVIPVRIRWDCQVEHGRAHDVEHGYLSDAMTLYR